MRMTDQEVSVALQENNNLNRTRKIFSGWCGKIDQAQRQKKPLSPIELRRMEFEAVRDIAVTLGVKL